MKRLTEWMVRRYLPDHTLVVVSPEEIKKLIGEKLPDHVLVVPTREKIEFLIEKHLEGYHLHKSPAKGRRKGVAEVTEVNQGGEHELIQGS